MNNPYLSFRLPIIDVVKETEIDYTYRFNITQHLQLLIEEEAKYYGFYLTPAIKESEANRVILKGSKSSTGIKLGITYTKFTR